MLKFSIENYYDTTAKKDNFCKGGSVGIFCDSIEEAKAFYKGGFKTLSLNVKRLLTLPSDDDPFFTTFDGVKSKGFYYIPEWN